MSGAIAALGARLSGPPPGFGLLYACGLVTTFQDRGFLAPSRATLSRSADILTQGLLVASLRRALASSSGATSLLVIDAFPRPDDADAGGERITGAAVTTLQAVVGGAPEPRLGMVVAVQAVPGAAVPFPGAPSPAAPFLAAAFAGALRDRRPGDAPLELGALVELLRLALAGRTGVTVLSQAPTSRAWLGPEPETPPDRPGDPARGAPAPRLAAVLPAPAPSSHAAVASSVQTLSAQAVAGPEAGPPPVLVEERATDAQRRQMQAALGRLGYYDGTSDGVFGPDTRAAMRRFQHELGADMTGHLATGQIARLLATP